MFKLEINHERQQNINLKIQYLDEDTLKLPISFFNLTEQEEFSDLLSSIQEKPAEREQTLLEVIYYIFICYFCIIFQFKFCMYLHFSILFWLWAKFHFNCFPQVNDFVRSRLDKISTVGHILDVSYYKVDNTNWLNNNKFLIITIKALNFCIKCMFINKSSHDKELDLLVEIFQLMPETFTYDPVKV